MADRDLDELKAACGRLQQRITELAAEVAAERVRWAQVYLSQRAVLDLLNLVDKASPGRMVVEVALVREAAETGRVPALPKRAALI